MAWNHTYSSIREGRIYVESNIGESSRKPEFTELHWTQVNEENELRDEHQQQDDRERKAQGKPDSIWIQSKTSSEAGKDAVWDCQSQDLGPLDFPKCAAELPTLQSSNVEFRERDSQTHFISFLKL